MKPPVVLVSILVTGIVLSVSLEAQDKDAGPGERGSEAGIAPASSNPASDSSNKPVTSLNGQTGAVALLGTNGVLVGPAAGRRIPISTNATPSRTAGSIVSRDSSGGFSAGSVDLSGNLNLATGGALTIGQKPFLGNPNSDSVSVGFGAGIGGGYQNSAVGSNALAFTTGPFNSAFGGGALHANQTGEGNSAFGAEALNNNLTGSNNDAFGVNALVTNTTGGGNVAMGSGALAGLAEGDRNVALGSGAGGALTHGNNNIYVGNQTFGNADDEQTIRIGTAQTATYIAGISGQPVAAGTAVLIDQNGRLGTAPSSIRFKEDVADIGDESSLLMRLRPVSFHYIAAYDSTNRRQYGLVAEDVAKVAPGLVLFDAQGRPTAIQYQFVDAMMLNELQKQNRLVEQQRRQLELQAQELEALRILVRGLAARLPE